MIRMKYATWLLVPLIPCLILSACAATSTNSTNSNENVLTVQGYATIFATPTQATLSLAVTTFNADVTKAQNENTQKMNQTFATLEKLNIPKEQIKTTAYQINQHFDYSNSPAEVTGYDVINQIEVTITDLNLVSQVIDETVKQGINQITQIQFALSKEKNQELYQEVLTKAVFNAKSKAKTLAKAANVNLKKPLRITENTDNLITPRYEINDFILAKSTSEETPILNGELTIEARVLIEYGY